MKGNKMNAGLVKTLTILLTLSASVGNCRKLEVAATVGVAQGEALFAIPCPGIIPTSFDSVMWLLHEENTLVGAGVNYNHHKYRYHASTGELAIQDVQYNDAGIYRCIVTYGQGDRKMELNHETKAVQLVVSQPYKDLWEEEYKGNTIRGFIAAGIAATVLLTSCFVYKYRWKESKYTQYSEELQLVSGMDNLGLMEDDNHRRHHGRSGTPSISSGINRDSPPPTPCPPPPSASPTPTTVPHVSHI